MNDDEIRDIRDNAGRVVAESLRKDKMTMREEKKVNELLLVSFYLLGGHTPILSKKQKKNLKFNRDHHVIEKFHETYISNYVYTFYKNMKRFDNSKGNYWTYHNWIIREALTSTYRYVRREKRLDDDILAEYAEELITMLKGNDEHDSTLSVEDIEDCWYAGKEHEENYKEDGG